MTARACGLCAALVPHVGEHVRRDHRAELAHPLTGRTVAQRRAEFRGILAAYLAAAAIVATAALTALIR